MSPFTNLCLVIVVLVAFFIGVGYLDMTHAMTWWLKVVNLLAALVVAWMVVMFFILRNADVG